MCEGPSAQDANQPNYMASVGKLFTSTIVSMLYEQDRLSFDDRISTYLDEELMQGLHVYKGTEYSQEITIGQLLQQRSGLYDNFWPLVKRLLEDDTFDMSPRDAILWGKENLKSVAPPGRKTYYTDTNYHLLGLIIESITGKPFDQVLAEYLFIPLGMKNSWMLHYSQPIEDPASPLAEFSLEGKILNGHKGYAGLDYAGGGVVAPPEDLLLFMKALVNHQLVREDTLSRMLSDSSTLYPMIDYGYGIWQLKRIPILLPATYYCWGCYGATGAFLFYHPGTGTYLIGSFNDTTYMRKGVTFLLGVLKRLLR